MVFTVRNESADLRTVDPKLVSRLLAELDELGPQS